MAKPHRMATITLGCLLAIPETYIYHTNYSLTIAAIIICFGSLITVITRTSAISKALKCI